MHIIDKTYDGHKYPIIERDYNAYCFPDNYNPENLDAYLEIQGESAENHEKVIVYRPGDIV